jgi:hypothetical protein
MLFNLTISNTVVTVLVAFAVDDPFTFIALQSTLFAMTLATIPMNIILYSAFFGKIHDRFTLFMAKPEARIGKYIGIIGISSIYVVANFALVFILGMIINIYASMIISWGLNVGVACMLELLARRIFSNY